MQIQQTKHDESAYFTRESVVTSVTQNIVNYIWNWEEGRNNSGKRMIDCCCKFESK
jgi:hypothetical protein